METEKEYISSDIEDVEHYLGELFQVPVGVCIADTHDIVQSYLHGHSALSRASSRRLGRQGLANGRRP